MRYFLLIVSMFFVWGLGYGQEKACPFPRKSISRPDSTKTQQLVKSIASLDLKAYYEVDKIPAFIKEAFLCWNNEWTIVNPEPPKKPFTIDTARMRLRHPEDSVLALAVNISVSGRSFNPERQLMYLGLNDQYMLIAYIGNNICWQYCPVMLFRFQNKKIISVMYWRSISEEVRTKEDVLKYLKCYDEPFLLLTI